MIQRFRSRSEEETAALGVAIAAILPAVGAIYLHGDLGAGKTALVRSIAAALGADPDEVSSPSFSVENEYILADGDSLIHLDCYRLGDQPREWEEIGIPDLLRGLTLTLVEWPKPGFQRYVSPSGTITIEVEPDESRVITVDLGTSIAHS